MPSDALRGVTLVALFGCLGAQVALLLQLTVSPFDFCLTAREAAEYIDVSFVWVHLGASITAASLGFCSFSLCLRAASDERRVERYVLAAACQATAVLCSSAGLTTPTSDFQQRTIRALMLAELVCVLLAISAAATSRSGPRLPVYLEEVETSHAFRPFFEDESGFPSLAKLERFLEVRSVRGSIRASLRQSNAALSACGAALCLLAFGHAMLEFRYTVGVQPPVFNSAALMSLNAPTPVEEYFGDTPAQPAGTARVVLVIVSGMRADALEVPALRELLAAPHVAPDALTLTLRAGPPSTSTAQWLALTTGASSRLTGVWGDVRLPETELDSVFRQARLHKLSSFVTGSPWLTEIFHSQLLRGERFYAEGAVPQPYAAVSAAAAAKGLTGSDTDRQRLLLLRRAMSASQSTDGTHRKLFELLVAQLSEVETQAHCAGATAVFNTRGSYAAAVGNLSSGLAQLIREMDSRTTLLVLADHGSIDRGGSGGAELHSTSVPLIVYKPGSGIGERRHAHERFSAAPRFNIPSPRTLDVAPTVSALLGVPAPRESEGTPIDELLGLANQQLLSLTYRDLYYQQQRLAAGLAASLHVPLTDAQQHQLGAPPAEKDILDLRDGILHLKALCHTILDSAAAAATATAFRWAVLSSTAFVLLLWWLVQRGSFADVRLVLRPQPGQYANRRAAAVAVCGTVSYFASAVGLHRLMLYLRGYSEWDSTPLAFPTEAAVFVIDVALPSLVSAFVIVRAYHFPYLVVQPRLSLGAKRVSKSPPPSARSASRGIAVLGEFARCLFLGDAAVYSDIAMIYLCKVYLVCCATVCVLGILCVQAYTCASSLPMLPPALFDAESGWTERFQLIVLQTIALVQLLVSTVMLRVWPGASLSVAYYDKLYSLALLKHEQQYGVSAKSEDLVGMLEEETAALVRANFRTVSVEEDD